MSPACRSPFALFLAVAYPFCFGTARSQTAPAPQGTPPSEARQAPQPTPAPEATLSAPATRTTPPGGNTAVDAETPQALVNSVVAMFTPNPSVNVESTGKPLPMTGSWGIQAKFPDGQPKRCLSARVPCVKVVYRVPEAKVVCEWTVGWVNAVEPQPDGTIKHALHEVVLDENDAAAHYTLRREWAKGEARPQPVVWERPVYPMIAASAHQGGVVSVRIVVGPDGLVKSAEATSGPLLMKDAIVSAVRKWKFNPMVIGQEPTSFRLDQQFAYNVPRPNISAGMDPSGQVVMPELDPRLGPGFRRDGASSGAWSNCAATGCESATPLTPK